MLTKWLPPPTTCLTVGPWDPVAAAATAIEGSSPSGSSPPALCTLPGCTFCNRCQVQDEPRPPMPSLAETAVQLLLGGHNDLEEGDRAPLQRQRSLLSSSLAGSRIPAELSPPLSLQPTRRQLVCMYG